MKPLQHSIQLQILYSFSPRKWEFPSSSFPCDFVHSAVELIHRLRWYSYNVRINIFKLSNKLCVTSDLRTRAYTAQNLNFRKSRLFHTRFIIWTCERWTKITSLNAFVMYKKWMPKHWHWRNLTVGELELIIFLLELLLFSSFLFHIFHCLCCQMQDLVFNSQNVALHAAYDIQHLHIIHASSTQHWHRLKHKIKHKSCEICKYSKHKKWSSHQTGWYMLFNHIDKWN